MTCCLTLTLPAAALAIFEEALAGFGGAFTNGPLEDTAPVAVEVYLAEAPDAGDLAAVIAAAANAAELPTPAYRLEPLPEIDWVAESQKALPAIETGRFYLYGSHVDAPPPVGAIALLVEAGSAFGTGRHETTRGCLLAFEALAKRQPISRALDMGCGSGVLAMAMAKLWNCPVLAVDNDPVSVRVTRENAVLNTLHGRIRALRSVGYSAAAVKRSGPYDLIAANILAPPLCAMARDLYRHLAPGGRAVLSGLLVSQEQAVLARHRDQGLKLEQRFHLAEWSTLVLRR